MSIAERLRLVRQRIERASESAGRDGDDVRLIAVSKTFGLPEIVEARDAGQSVFGENRAQELARKHAELSGGVEWHFVGHLQTNKVKQVVGAAELIHSVDSLKIAEAIAKRAEALGLVQDVLIEVNVAGDERKHGLDPDCLGPLVAAIGELEGIRVRGLMTIPPWPDDPQDSRPHYARLADLGTKIPTTGDHRVELSMGMTRDFEIAIEEGATLVRVGEAIFGPRKP